MPDNHAPIITSVGELSDAALEALADLLIDGWEREQATAVAAAEGQEVAR